MKQTFGTAWSRWWRGGVLLSTFESWALDALVVELPPHLRPVVEAQFQIYALVQREVDGRALNFYPGRREMRQLRKGDWGLPVPLLSMNCEVAPLIRLKIHVQTPPTDLHAVLRAVRGRVFSISFSEDVRPLADASHFEATEITHAWRSTFPSIGNT